MNKITKLCLMLGCLLMTGCSTLKQKKGCDNAFGSNKCQSLVVSKPMDPRGAESGMMYALPKQQIKFKINRVKVTQKGLEAALKSAEEQEQAIKSALNTHNKETVDKLKHHHKHVKLDANVASVTHLLEIALIDQQRLNEQLIEAQKATNAVRKKLAEFSGDVFEDQISLTQLPLLPDNNNVLVAKINKNALSSDTFELKTTRNGLLSGGMGQSEGQLDDIFVSLASAFAHVKATSRKPIKMKPKAPQAAKPDSDSCSILKEDAFEYTIDVNHSAAFKKLNAKMPAECFAYRVEPVTPLPAADCEVKDYLQISANKTYGYYDGLLYPRVSVVQFDVIKLRQGTEPELVVHSFFPEIINACQLGVLPINKALFANEDHEFEFNDGLLTRYKTEGSSEVTAFLGMFPAAAQSLISIPAEILQLRVNYQSKEKAYYDALLEAHQSRMNYQDALSDDTEDSEE
jgi:hypothetical protein